MFLDPRTIDWFLVGSPASLFTILVTYVYFCKYAGPQYMRDRKPFDLKNVIIFYNAFQVFLSAYLVYEVNRNCIIHLTRCLINKCNLF